MKVILDANVLIAAVAGRGLCESILELCLEEHELIVSSVLLDEVYRGLIKKIKLPESMAREFCALLRKNATAATPVAVAEGACRDPKDLHLLGLCDSTTAVVLVTGDRDLIDSGWRGPTKIVTPRAFWEYCGRK